jgi:hypothetical protein
MKNNDTFRSIVKFLTLGCIIALSGSVQAAEVIIDAKIETPNIECSIYKLAVPRASKREAVNRCAQIMKLSGVRGFSSDMMKPVEDRMAFYDKGIEVSINNTRTEFFYSNFSALKLTGKTGRLPSDEKAIELSRAYLKKTGLMPGNDNELVIDHVGGIMQMLSNARAPEKKAVVVYFNRELDGLKVKNFGSSMTITLTESKVPTGVQYHWREVASKEKVNPERFLGEEKIKELIMEDVNRVFAEKAQVLVNKIGFVLYDNGGNYIQPAYCYEGVRKADGEKEGEGFADMPVLGYVQALDQVFEPISHPAYSPKRMNPVSDENETDE